MSETNGYAFLLQSWDHNMTGQIIEISGEMQRDFYWWVLKGQRVWDLFTLLTDMKLKHYHSDLICLWSYRDC